MNKDEIFRRAAQCSGTVLSFPDRGEWGDSRYRGNFSGWIPATLIYRYGSNSVSEIFAGGGTTSDLCRDLGIPYIGIDLNPNPVRQDIVSMDILSEEELPDLFYQSDLQILHPPYPEIQHITYANQMYNAEQSVAGRDIQQMSWKDGMAAINKAIMKGYAAMQPGSYQAYVIGDIRRKIDGRSVFRSMMADIVMPGELQQVLIKMQHNTWSGRKGGNYGKCSFFLIEHEYVVVVKKPSGYEIAFLMPERHHIDIRDAAMATWKDVVMAVIRKTGAVDLDTVYKAVDGRKKAQNAHWKEKVRQTLQKLVADGLCVRTARGQYAVA